MKRSILRAETPKIEFHNAYFGAAKPFAIVAYRGQLFGVAVAFNNRKYMAAP
jgi:hypothetical protein